MPIQPFFDFTKVPLQSRPTNQTFGNLLSNALTGYQEGQQFKEEQRKRVLTNEEQQLKNSLDKLYDEEKRKAEINYLNNKALTEEYGPRLAKAEIENKMAQAWAHRNPYGPPDTEVLGQLPKDIPESSIGRPFYKMPKNEQLYESKEMDKQLHKAQNMEATLPIIYKLRNIMKENPSIWKSYNLILSDPEKKDSIVSTILKNNLVNEKEKTAIDLFSKFTGDLILKGGEGLGGQQRITDSLRSLMRQVKPDIRNTPQANNAVLDSIEDTMSVGPAMAQAYRWGKKHRVTIIDDPEAFKNIYKNKKTLGSIPENQDRPGDPERRGQNNQAFLKKVLDKPLITDADIDATALKYNMTKEQVKQKLGIE